MTPERRKYIASISNEERAIRSELYSKKIRLSDLKWNVKFSTYKDVRTTSLELIKETKIIIRALKKQLPAPLLERPICLGSEMYYFCSACGIVLISDTDNYCFKCGQKLR